MLLYRQECHSDAVGAGQRQIESKFRAFPGVEIVGNLNQNSCTIASFGIATTGPTMREIEQNLDSVTNNVMALFATDAGYEADPAGIVLLRWIVKTLRERDTIFNPDAGHCGVSLRNCYFKSVIPGLSQRLRAQPIPHSKHIPSIL
jgi:hypothetical protein